MRLNRLKIEAIRGIPLGWPSVPIGDSGLVIYGPNGSGKSSIIDGIEASLEMESSLYPEKRQGVSWEKGSEHIHGGPRRSELFGVAEGKEYNLTTLAEATPAVLQWKEAASSSVFVLRRHMLLHFIMSQAAERYSRLEGFFNLRYYSALETALTSLLNSSQTAQGGLELNERVQLQKLRLRLVLQDGQEVTAEVAEGHLSAKLKACGMADARSATERSERREQANAELAGIAADSRLALLLRYKAAVEELLPSSMYEPMLGQLAELQQAYLTARQESTSIASADFLKAAQQLIQSRNLVECPVCEQAINPALTVASLQSRIENDAKVSAALSALRQHRTSVATAISAHVTAFKGVFAGYGKLIGGELQKPYHDEGSLLDQLNSALSGNMVIENLPDLRSALKATIASHEGLLAEIASALAQTGAPRRALLVEVVDALNIIESK